MVAQEKSDKFLATIRMENSNFVDLLLPKFQNRAGVQDRGPVNPLLVAPKRSNVAASPTVGTTSASSVNLPQQPLPLRLPYRLLRQFLRENRLARKNPRTCWAPWTLRKRPRKSILAIMGRIAYARIVVLKKLVREVYFQTFEFLLSSY